LCEVTLTRFWAGEASVCVYQLENVRSAAYGPDKPGRSGDVCGSSAAMASVASQIRLVHEVTRYYLLRYRYHCTYEQQRRQERGQRSLNFQRACHGASCGSRIYPIRSNRCRVIGLEFCSRGLPAAGNCERSEGVPRLGQGGTYVTNAGRASVVVEGTSKAPPHLGALSRLTCNKLGVAALHRYRYVHAVSPRGPTDPSIDFPYDAGQYTIRFTPAPTDTEGVAPSMIRHLTPDERAVRSVPRLPCVNICSKANAPHSVAM
jgi:hypothetical protein